MTELTEKELQELTEVKVMFDQQLEIADKLQKANPDIHPITALIMSGDIMSRKAADEALAEGLDVTYAVWRVGSFARFDWVAEQFWAGNIDLETLSKHICMWWRNSDPNDTNPVFLDLWQKVKAYNKDKVLTDKKHLPRQDSFVVYRGQDPGNENLGLSWSLSKDIAQKFANGAAKRVPDPNGIVVRGIVERDKIIAYITERHEEEIIVDPTDVEIIDGP